MQQNDSPAGGQVGITKPGLAFTMKIIMLFGMVVAAVGETIILLHPPLPSEGVLIGMENDRTLADG